MAILPIKVITLVLGLYGALKITGAGKAIPVLIGGKLLTSKYRAGEGPLSDQMVIDIGTYDPVGCVIWQLGEQDPGFKRFRGRTFSLTKSEQRSFSAALDALGKRSTAALLDFLEQYPR